MKNETADSLKYQDRVYTDKALIPKIEEDLRVILYALIGEKELIIDYKNDGYNVYPSCHDWLKSYCQAKKKYYRARLPEHDLVWYGDSYIEIYCNIIASIAGNRVYTPFSSIPRSIPKDEDDENYM